MANGHGGKRAGAGRKPGSANRKTSEIANAAIKNGVTPLDYMLSVLRDPNAGPERRDRMAIAAAPYIHPRLNSVQHNSNANALPLKRPIFNISFPTPPHAEEPMIDATRQQILIPERVSPALLEQAPREQTLQVTRTGGLRKAAPAASVYDIRLAERLPVQGADGFSGRRR
jgi:hypothetical protein